MKNVLLAVVLYCFGCFQSLGQSVLPLENPSFEANKPEPGVIPEGWLDMGAFGESPPDIQPGIFDVVMKAQHGATFLGLVVRDNNTWEGIGQELGGYLEKDSTYRFSLYLGRSNAYRSISRMSGQEANFNNPTILKIWGVNTKTKQEELLAQSSAVSHSQWTLYSFLLKPTVADFDEIDLMAYYAPGFEQKNGNLLIDNCSDIVKINESK
jgi:hypothetical protein